MIALLSYRSYLLFLLLTALRLSVGVAWAQNAGSQIASTQVRIAQDLAWIHSAEQDHRCAAEQGELWAQLASEYHYAAEFPKAEDAYDHSLRFLKTVPAARAEYATTLENLSALYLIYGRINDAANVRKQALAVRKKLGNPLDIGVAHLHLADVALARRQFKKAERLEVQGIAEMESAPNPPRVAMLSAMITVTYARCLRGHCGEGLMSAQQAVAYANQHFERESAAVGFALETLGFAQWQTGAGQAGETAMLHGLRILRATLVPSDPRLGGALLQYQNYLIAVNRRVEAQTIGEEVARMTKQGGLLCPACTVSAYSLSKTLR